MGVYGKNMPKAIRKSITSLDMLLSLGTETGLRTVLAVSPSNTRWVEQIHRAL